MFSNRIGSGIPLLMNLGGEPLRVALLAILVAYTAANPGISSAAPDDRVNSVSMVVLLVSPEQHAGQRVDVTGFLTMFFIFVTEEAAFRVDTASALAFVRSDEEDAALIKCRNNHARITARLVRDADFDVYRLAELESIRVYDISDGTSKTCWRRPSKYEPSQH